MNGDAHDRLRALIGKTCTYGGLQWRITEILADEDQLVLESLDQGTRQVQRGLYGHPNRRGPEQLALPISDESGGYSEEVLTLLAGSA